MTIREHISRLQRFAEGRTLRPSDDLSLPNRLVYVLMRMYKNSVEFSDRIKRGVFDRSTVLVIPCVELEKVDIVECPCAPASGCTFSKSKFPLPRLIAGKLISVTTVNSGVEFTYVKWNNFKDKINSRFGSLKSEPYYTLKNIDSSYHLYIYSSGGNKNIRAVQISGLFSDPMEVSEFPVCGDNKKQVLCNPLEEEFTLNPELESIVYELTLQSLGASKSLSTHSDVLNNTNDDTEAQVPE